MTKDRILQALPNRCPECGSGNIRNRYGKRWDCRKCDARFAHPATVILTLQPAPKERK